ncbi:MAG TPA: hypothetical protein VHP83_21645 [Aggregatilineaceae bacterium]|nr:hypothetical protein [Aggregatilineaceae bacterium]
MSSVPRIVTVDAAHGVTRIVRGALTLLNRAHILIEVPTAEDALEEVQNSNIALVVTAYRMDSGTNGVELATNIAHESLGTPVIVLAEEGDALESFPDAPFQIFTRPVAEPFLRGMRLALDGPAAVADEQAPAKDEVDLGPVPAINVNDLHRVVSSLIRDVGAMGVILADRTGRVLIDEGATGYIDREKLALILGPAFARSADMSPLIGGDAWTMHYYDGERLDVFGLSLGLHYFMGLIFEGSNRAAFGAVMMFGRRAADQMISMIGDAAYSTRKPEPAPVKVKEPVKAAPPPEPPPSKKEKKKTKELSSLFDKADAISPDSLGEFDAEALFGQAIDENIAASLFDSDAVSSLLKEMEGGKGERVGYDEAIDMGILNE